MTQYAKWYEGESFVLTPQQVEQIRPMLDELEERNLAGDKECVLLAQVWSLEGNEVRCCVHFVPSDRAKVMYNALHADRLVAVAIDERKGEGR